MPDLADPVLPITRTDIIYPVLVLRHLTTSFYKLFSLVFHNGYSHRVLHAPYPSNHHCTYHLPDYGEPVSLLALAEAHTSAEDQVEGFSSPPPGYCSHDFPFRGPCALC